VENTPIPDANRDVLRTQWHEFIDATSECRPQLFSYCRHLAQNPWEAEDLLQDTLLRAFSTMSQVDDPIRNVRSYVLRIATNLWLDQVRRARLVEWVEIDPESIGGSPAEAERNAQFIAASKRLLQAGSPRQIAAVLMKDVFGASLAEISVALQSTEGAVKGLLSRARSKLTAPVNVPSSAPVPSKALVDRFVELYNDADQEGLLDLILDNAVAGNVGTDIEWGYESHRSRTSWVRGSLGGHPEWPRKFQFESQTARRAEFMDEPIVLVYRTRSGENALESIVRLVEEDGMIAELKAYSFSPELKEEVARHFDVAVRSGGYRYPTPGAGRRFMDESEN